MNFNECITKLKDLLASMGYNVMGYNHSEQQLKKLQPWFYPKKKKNPLPDSILEYLKYMENKYPLAAQIKKKTMGQWYGPYFFFAIKADGMNYDQLKEKFEEFENDLLDRYNHASKKEAYEINASNYIPMNMLGFIFEEISDDLYEQARTLNNKTANVGKLTKPYIFDLKNRRVDRDSAKIKVIGAPKPKDFAQIFD